MLSHLNDSPTLIGNISGIYVKICSVLEEKRMDIIEVIPTGIRG